MQKSVKALLDNGQFKKLTAQDNCKLTVNYVQICRSFLIVHAHTVGVPNISE
jgi:hypothetical protein